MAEILKFDDPVMLVGGGEVDQELLQSYSHLPVVAADGGANLLRRLSIVPSAVIGDLDSVEDLNHWRKVSKVIALAEQDTTDFEKCLYSIDAPWFIATGFTGSRFDHTLAVLHVMQKWHSDKSVYLVSGSDCVCVKSDTVELQLPVGTRVSVYPLNRITFASSSGLTYPLNKLTMQPGKMIGTSNSCSESAISIVPEDDSGCFVLIVPVSELNALIQCK